MSIMNDKQILDACDEAMAAVDKDPRYPRSPYFMRIGLLEFRVEPGAGRSFRQMVSQALIGDITDRLTDKPPRKRGTNIYGDR